MQPRIIYEMREKKSEKTIGVENGAHLHSTNIQTLYISFLHAIQNHATRFLTSLFAVNVVIQACRKLFVAIADCLITNIYERSLIY